jgi:general secretion pathway protein J
VRARAHGFTMMEVMIAITLLSIVGAMLYEGLGSAIDAKEQIEVISDRYDEIRIAMSRMATEISMAYLSDHYSREERRSKTLFREDRDGEGDRLVFTSFSHVRRVRDARESDQNVLTYWVDSDPQDGRRTALLRTEKVRIDETTGEDILVDDKDAHTDVLCSGVKDLTLDYWNETDKDWVEDWDSESLETGNKLPPRVRIRLRVELDETRDQVFETQAEILLRVPVKLSAN